MSRLLRTGGLFAFVLVAVTLIGATALDTFGGQEVLFITPKADEAVELDREFWEPGDPVAEIYGTPADRTARVLFPDRGRIINPREDPTLVLLMVDKAKGENPFQVKMLWFFTWRVVVALGLLGVLGLGLSALPSLRRRSV